MRSHSYILAGLIVFLVVGAMGNLLMGAKNVPTVPTPQTDQISALPASETITPAPAEGTRVDPSLMITVSEPLPDATVTSPLRITGSARGNWYFEASFPVRLVDAQGNTIAQVPAQAQGEWMTENFVPFVATLTWATSSVTGATGTLILMRDNPSGLPEHDAQIEIPVIF
jgi:hypothetical protein